MKLKGKNTEKLPEAKKEKMEETLERMEEIRNIDTINLRVRINKKIEFLNSEKEKASTYIENFKSKIIELEQMSLKIDGALVALKELLKDDSNV